ncbi:MAG: BPSS1187 family protein, partial [Bacteroidota bacterium]
MRATLMILLGLVLITMVRAQSSYKIAPSATNPAIDGRDTLHFASIDRTATPLGKLFVFFPGTGASPGEYTLIVQTAARLGYHAIGLSYENEIPPEFLCITSADTTCHERSRREIWFGENVHEAINVDVDNSIYNRLVQLLKYLQTQHADDNWTQYLNASDSIIWSKVAFSGHSQGGGHAGIISKLEQVDRVIIFASRDYMAIYGEHAKWMQRPGKTPPDSYFGFTHRLDTNAYGLNHEILDAWSHYQMDQFGEIVSVDTVDAPFLNRHMFTSNLPEPPGSNVHHYYHRTVAGDLYTPHDENGIPVYLPVW